VKLQKQALIISRSCSWDFPIVGEGLFESDSFVEILLPPHFWWLSDDVFILVMEGMVMRPVFLKKATMIRKCSIFTSLEAK